MGKYTFMRFIYSFVIRSSRFWSDTTYLKIKFKYLFGKNLNLKNPQMYSEKLQWMKLYDRNPLYTMLADKVMVKNWVGEKIGNEYIIPTLGVWDSPEDIPFDSLPDKFVLKCNHNSGLGMYICKDKSSIKPEKWRLIKRNLRLGLKQDYYLTNREWCYKNINRKILCEQFMEDKSQNGNLNDYKFFCFDGKVKMMFVATDRFDESGNDHNVKFDFFDRDFNHLPFTNGHPNSNKPIKKPVCWDKMVEISEILASGLHQVRVDLYVINGHIYFGEMTFYHFSGLVRYEPEEWDYLIGSYMNLP